MSSPVGQAPSNWRVLGATEERELRARVRAAWGFGATPYWFPLDRASRPDVLALQAPYFRRALTHGALQGLVAAHGVERVWELREYGESYELPVEDLDPGYTGAEGFWCSAGLDWALYASHESSITVAGQWLVDAVQQAWPEWARRCWTTPFF